MSVLCLNIFLAESFLKMLAKSKSEMGGNFVLDVAYVIKNQFREISEKKPVKTICYYSKKDLGNSECYRILGESLDIMQEICKYYIEISRYRDALGYIREGLDITQLHFSNRRISQFMLHQISADLIAQSLTESTTRLKLAENLCNGYENSRMIDIKNLTFENMTDLLGVKNQISLNNMKMLNEIKLQEQARQQADAVVAKLDTGSLVSRLNQIYTVLTENKLLNSYCIDQLIEAYFIVCNYLKQFKLTIELKTLVKQLQRLLIRKSSASSETASYMYENWHVSEFYCLVFEIDSNMAGLNLGGLLFFRRIIVSYLEKLYLKVYVICMG